MSGQVSRPFIAMVRGVLVVVTAIALSIAAAELMLRIYVGVTDTNFSRTIAKQDPLAVIRVPHGMYGYRQKPNAVQDYANGTVATANEMGFRGPSVAWEKPAGVFRIVLLGGSATHGWGTNDDETIDAFMRELLAKEYPTQPIEVVNLALDGYDSAQVFERMRSDGTRLSPDLVIVNSGVNDVRNARHPKLGPPPDATTSIWESAMGQMRREQEGGGPGGWTVAKHYSYLARLPGVVSDRRRRSAAVAAQERIEPSLAAVDYFAQSLELTWELVAQSNAALILSKPPSALATRYSATDQSPQRYWINDAATTDAYRKRLAKRMEEMAARLSGENHPVRFVAHELPPEAFLDDCHLNPRGNRALAARFVEDASEFLDATNAGTEDP